MPKRTRLSRRKTHKGNIAAIRKWKLNLTNNLESASTSQNHHDINDESQESNNSQTLVCINETKNSVPFSTEMSSNNLKAEFDLQTVFENVSKSDSTVPAGKTVPDKDRSHYNPGVLKTPLSDALQTQKEVLSSPKHSTVQPTENNCNRENKSRSQPVLKKTETGDLALAKPSTLSSAQAVASEEHLLQMKILELQLKQEEEKYTQEKIKTELLKQQLFRETLTTWDVLMDE